MPEPTITTPHDPKALIREAYAVASEAYRGDAFRLAAASGYAHWLRRFEPRIPAGSRLLELGCGNGIPVARELAKRHSVTGVDISDTQIARARVLVPKAEFLCADMTQVQFEPNSFDAITAFFSIINVPLEEQPQLIRAIAGWLKPGGHVLAIVGKIKGTWVEREWRGVRGISMYYSHAGIAESRASFAAAGLEIVEEGTEPANGDPGFAVLVARKTQGKSD